MIKLIQGDTLNLSITVEHGAELIEELYFSCEFLKLSKTLTKIDDTHYMVNFDAEFTCNCPVCTTSFDITAKLKDDQIVTVIYNDPIKVLKKENVIDGNQD